MGILHRGSVGAQGGELWLDGWGYGRELSVPSSKVYSSQTNAIVPVYLSPSTFDFAKAKSDGSDIRFTDSLLNFCKHEKVEWTRGQASFDGNGDYISLSDFDGIKFGSSVYTIEGKINTSVIGGTYFILATDDTNGYNGWHVRIENNKLRFVLANGSSGWGISSTTSINVNTNYDYAIQYDGSLVKIFINGVLDTSGTPNIVSTNNSLGMRISNEFSPANRCFNGKIMGTRITKGRARYTTNYTPPQSFTVDGSDVVLCTNFESASSDLTGKQYTLNGNVAITTPFAKFNVLIPTLSSTVDTTTYMWYGNPNAYNTSLEAWQDQTGKALTYNGNAKLEYDVGIGKRRASFDGNGDYISLADSSDWVFGTADMCIEWDGIFNALPTSGNYYPMYNQYASSGTVLLVRNTGGTYTVEFGNTYPSGVEIVRTVSLSVGTRYKIKIYRIGNIFRMIINDVQQGADVTWAGSMNDSSSPFVIGGYDVSGSPKYFNGYMFGMRITKGRSRSGESFPTSFAIDGADVVFCTNFDTIYDQTYSMVQHMGDSLVDATGNGNNGTVNGTTVVNTALGKVRNFNGNTDYISIPYMSLLDIKTNNTFSVKVMYNPTKQGDIPSVIVNTLFSTGDVSSWSTFGWTCDEGNNQIRFRVANGSAYTDELLFTSTINLHDGKYHRVEIVLAGLNFKCYVDGIQMTQVTLQSSSFVAGYKSYIANQIYLQANRTLLGTISNVAIDNTIRTDAWLKTESLALRNELFNVRNIYKKMAEPVTTTVDGTSVSFTSLSLVKGETYLLTARVTATVDTVMYLTINNNEAYTNYYTQLLVGNSSTVAGSNTNAPIMISMNPNETSLCRVLIKLTGAGDMVAQSSCIRNARSTTPQITENYIGATFTSTSIATLKVTSSVVNGMKAESSFTLERIGGGL